MYRRTDVKDVQVVMHNIDSLWEFRESPESTINNLINRVDLINFWPRLSTTLTTGFIGALMCSVCYF